MKSSDHAMKYYTPAVFNGFRNRTIGSVTLATTIGGSVAMECDFLEGIPRPQVEWYMNDDPVSEIREETAILYVEGGRFLFIRFLQAWQQYSLFHCAVIQTINNTTILSQRAPISYNLRGSIPYDTLVVYLGDRSFNMVAEEPEPVEVVFAAAYRSTIFSMSSSQFVYLLYQSCLSSVQGTGVAITFVSDVVLMYSGLADAGQWNFTCDAFVLNVPRQLQDTRATFSFNITRARKY